MITGNNDMSEHIKKDIRRNTIPSMVLRKIQYLQFTYFLGIIYKIKDYKDL